MVIGGVGGSGTRLPALLLCELGFHLGGLLNAELDNLWFALLFRRPSWYREKPAQVPIALRLFTKAMEGEPSLDHAEKALLRAAVRERDVRIFRGPASAMACARSLRASQGPPTDALGWGWKNPSNHVYLEDLARAYPRLRYIHIIRNGLDLVANPKLFAQLDSWGPLLGVDPPADRGLDSSRQALRYWIAANRRALALARRLLGDRHLVLRYESICRQPRQAVAEVASFLDISPTPDLEARFASLVERPAERRADGPALAAFPEEELAAVREMGFSIAGRR